MDTNKTRNFHVLMMLTKRHLKMIFANHIRMMYTLMVPIVILVVYILFLRDMEIMAAENALYGERWTKVLWSRFAPLSTDG